MISIIILDFDGVILESVSVKTEAFRTLFSFAPEYVEEIVQFHKDNGGMSRFDKFRYIFDHILKRELDPDTFNALSEKFSILVFQGVVNAPFVPGPGSSLNTGMLQSRCISYLQHKRNSGRSFRNATSRSSSGMCMVHQGKKPNVSVKFTPLPESRHQIYCSWGMPSTIWQRRGHLE